MYTVHLHNTLGIVDMNQTRKEINAYTKSDPEDIEHLTLRQMVYL